MPFPHAHALLIGVGSYAQAPQLDVPITAADASAVAAVLRDPQFCGYPTEQVALLSDAAATRDGALAASVRESDAAPAPAAGWRPRTGWRGRRRRCAGRCQCDPTGRYDHHWRRQYPRGRYLVVAAVS